MAELPLDQSRIPPPIAQFNSQQIISVPTLYFNGFANSLGDTDIGSILMLDGVPVARLCMSFTTAKTYVKYLSELIGTLESATQHTIMVSNDVAQALQARGGSK